MFDNLKLLSDKIENKKPYSSEEIMYLKRIINDDQLLNKASSIIDTLEHNPFSPLIEKDIVHMIMKFSSGFADCFILPHMNMHNITYATNPEKYQQNIINYCNDFKSYLLKYKMLSQSFIKTLKDDSKIIRWVYNTSFDTGNAEYFKIIQEESIESFLDYAFLILYRATVIMNIALYNKESYGFEYDELYTSIQIIFTKAMDGYFNKDDNKFDYFISESHEGLNFYLKDSVSQLMMDDTTIKTCENIDDGSFEIILVYIVTLLYRYYLDIKIYKNKFVYNNKFSKNVRIPENLYKIYIEDKYVKKLVRIMSRSTQHLNEFKSDLFIEIFKQYCIENYDNKSINYLKLL